jgi:hypothetical protein
VEPIATYQGKWLEGSYRFDLFPDELRVVGSTYFRSYAEAGVALATLQLRVDRLWVRSSLFVAGLWLLVAAFVVYSVVSTLNLAPFGSLAAFWISPGIGGLCCTLAAARKTEFARFVTDAGTPAVIIPRTRADDGFDEFIDRILTQIRDCKGLA